MKAVPSKQIPEGSAYRGSTLRARKTPLSTNNYNKPHRGFLILHAFAAFATNPAPFQWAMIADNLSEAKSCANCHP